MIYPLLPTFLATSLAAGPAALGLIEGIAESTASLLKVLSGLWSDRLRVRKPLVTAGYSVSSVARPLIGLAGSWVGVLALRFADRIGKGIRTSPRDALIAEATPRELLGAAFGFHRSMDHAGAVLGPLIAAALLGAGLSLRGVFLLAAVPSAAVLLVLALGVREAPRALAERRRGAGTRQERLSPGFRRLLASTVLFTLGNSTDAFLLLRLGKAGVPASGVALLWSAHHVVKMASTYYGGRLSDGWGRKPLLLAGWLYYAAVYAGFAFFDSTAALIVLFLAYGVYYGLTEPVVGAWAAELSPGGLRGRAYGYYHGAVGGAALPASLLFGFLWNAWGMEAAFLTGSALALAASGVLLGVPAKSRDRSRGTA
ncbi:MAG: MFS transporter [Deltaproteobacteria bacterium]|nr:MFS transporter [Deltaproteobacteria bacterium]